MGSRVVRVLALCLAISCAPAGAGELPETLLLLTLDTTRADHLGNHGYRRDTSPALDALANGGLRVRRAFSPMPSTDPAHLSMLTGLYPRSHGVKKNGVPLPVPEIPNLAKWAKVQGYQTAAFVSRPHLTPSQLGLVGFDFESGPSDHERRGAETLAAAKEWLSHRAPEERVFLWIHFFEPHTPYEPPEPFDRRFTEPELKDLPKQGRQKGGPAMRRHRVDLYDGEIAYLDTLVAETVAWARARGPSGRSPLFVIAADHGEVLDELFDTTGRAFFHSKMLAPGSLAIPLIVNWEGYVDPGQVLAGPAGLTDVAPTIFELLGREGFETQGTGLFARGRGGVGDGSDLVFSEREVFSLARQWEYRATDQFAVSDGRYQLVVTDPFSRTDLYDLDRDPGGLNDLSDEMPEVADRLLAELRSWLERVPEPGVVGADVPAEKIDALRALGYIE